MATPFNIKKTTQVGRNGFDLSQRHLFGAVPGMLLPIMYEDTLPGDSFKLGLDSFTRMRPMQTAAFARFKEYFDFFFVSKDTLWPYYNAMVVNNNEPQQLPNAGSTSVPSVVPNMLMADLLRWVREQTAATNDDMDVPFAYGTVTLGDLLGLGDLWRASFDEGQENLAVSLLPWCCYQRIYADYYRNPQWERRDVLSYNLRNFYGDTNRISLGAGDFDRRVNMFKMRYANWHKDYFMGLYPSQQFGDVSVVSVDPLVKGYNSTYNSAIYNTGTNQSGRLPGQLINAYNDLVTSELSIIDLRRAQALQRLKEVTMTNGSSMYQQVKAHFGFELPEGRKDAAEYIGGFDNVVVIDDVDATASGSNTDQTSSVGQIFGKARAASDPNKVLDFTAKDFGYIMCIYHVEPLLDYSALGIKHSNLILTSADEFTPEFDKIGFGSLQSFELLAPNSQLTLFNSFTMGYTSRYLDRKVSYDRLHGSFMHRDIGNTDESWAVGLGRGVLNDRLQTGNLDFRFFKVDPYIANNIMQVTFEDADIGGLVGFEPFMVKASFNIYKSSNMSVDSLPM